MQLLEKNNFSAPTRWNVVSIGRGGGSTVDRMVGFPLGWIFILSGWRRIHTDIWTTQDNSSYHNNVKMRVDAWKNQGAKVFANCKAIVANSIFFSKLATMANGSWSISNSIADICNSFSDISNAINDIYNSIGDISNSIKINDICNSFSDICK